MDSVVMLTCDHTPFLAEFSIAALESFKQTEGKFEMIVIDNGSKFGSGQVRGYTDIYVRNKENVGYPGAVNQGMSLANGEYVCIANNDIKVSPNWLTVAHSILEDPTVGSVHFRMIPYDEPIVLGNDVWVGGKERWCSSSFFVIRKEAFQGYDMNYGFGGYDDYSHHYRMRQKGWIQAYTNKAVYQHADSSTYLALEYAGDKRSERDQKNREYFKKQHGEYPDILFAKEFPEQMSIPWKPFP